MAADDGTPQDHPGSDAGAADGPATGGEEAGDDADGESMPPFLRYGIFTVAVYGAAVTALGGLSSVDVGGPALVAFTAGFLLFMTTYFAAMWAGWLYLT